MKMVHNGIEYADMQLICEAYWLMSHLLGLTSQRMSEVFRAWNQGELSSYLIGITADILATQDPESESALVDMILDTAEQKGTGKWRVYPGMKNNFRNRLTIVSAPFTLRKQ